MTSFKPWRRQSKWFCFWPTWHIYKWSLVVECLDSAQHAQGISLMLYCPSSPSGLITLVTNHLEAPMLWAQCFGGWVPHARKPQPHWWQFCFRLIAATRPATWWPDFGCSCPCLLGAWVGWAEIDAYFASLGCAVLQSLTTLFYNTLRFVTFKFGIGLPQSVASWSAPSFFLLCCCSSVPLALMRKLLHDRHIAWVAKGALVIVCFPPPFPMF